MNATSPLLSYLAVLLPLVIPGSKNAYATIAHINTNININNNVISA